MLNRARVHEGNQGFMQRALKGLFFVLPFLFGIGFIAPLTAELMAAVHVDAPAERMQVADIATLNAFAKGKLAMVAMWSMRESGNSWT